ncbi:hypothetical protein POTOM_060333 [Populus tomentosa]|uniref:Uncharacterized protein n=1 Tax=Populus tomentosa TaxID=118781 RepID=A0A8X7XUS8_POPTO|nr:hypothetical protein POTOM_060333 [Populus tomentosa]
MIRPISLLYFLPLLLLLLLSLYYHVLADSHFEGFEAEEEDDVVEETIDPNAFKLPDLPLTLSESPPISTPTPDPKEPDPKPTKPSPPPSTTNFEFWDEDEFEGLPSHQPHIESVVITESATPDATVQTPDPKPTTVSKKKQSLLGGDCVCVGEGDDSPLLLKEGQNVFKFYASGRRYCQGLLATMELKSRHDLLSRIYNMVVPCKDEISIEVYMNDDAMDHVVFALARKKMAKAMQKELRDLQRFAGIVVQPPNGRKWVAEELAVVSESKEVAGDLITEAVLEQFLIKEHYGLCFESLYVEAVNDQVFGEKSFEKYGKGFISMHVSDQLPGTQKKMLLFKFALPDANNMADMTRLVALVPYYIDLVGRYKLSFTGAHSKTEAARAKAAQEAYKELQGARQEALQKKKAERKKMLEEAEAKLSAEAIRKKEEKEACSSDEEGNAKSKMTRGH